QLGEQDGTLEMSVVVGLQEGSDARGSVGFELGVRSELGDYRSSLIFGEGIRMGLTLRDNDTIGGFMQGSEVHSQSELPGDNESILSRLRGGGLRLRVVLPADPGHPALQGEFPIERLDGTVLDRSQIGRELRLDGNIALGMNFPARPPRQAQGRRPAESGGRFWFRDWKVAGTELVENPDHAFGPILYSMYTLSRGTMTMTAQMPPLG